MNISRHLFLDLEDTVVTPIKQAWDDFEFMNLEKIRRIMKEFKPTKLHLFSFAIWNAQELAKFNKHLRPHIEDALRMKFSSTWTVDEDIIPMCCNVMKIGTVDFDDLSCFWSKQESFRLSVRSMFGDAWASKKQETEVLLLGDIVLNEDFSWPDLRISGRIMNIDTIE